MDAMEMTRSRFGHWHEGERAAHERAGVAARMETIADKVLRRFMTDQHRDFYPLLPFLVVGWLDAQARPFASLLFGPAGFATSPDPTHLDITALPPPADGLAAVLAEGTVLGMLGIELPTLRRNRLNGKVVGLRSDGFALAVDQSFGNCAQYIHRRGYAGSVAGPMPGPVTAEPLARLDAEARALIARADTAFIASTARATGGAGEAGPAAGDPDHGVDVSHRGGTPGFLRLDRGGRIVLPDYRGNFFFNTLGNLMLDPRVGLTLVDFENGDLLQLTGHAGVIWEGPELAEHPGAQRLIRIEPAEARWLRGGFPLRTSLVELSPQAIAAAMA